MDFIGTKERHERETEEAERLVRPLPKVKPPRRDKRREDMQVDKDPDLSKKDEDLSKNRREIGGSTDYYRGLVREVLEASDPNLYSSYPLQVWQIEDSMPSKDSNLKAVRLAIYHGIEPYPADKGGLAAYPKFQQGRVRDLTAEDYSLLIASAKEWLKSSVLSKAIDGMVPDARFRAALDLAIRSAEDGRYGSVVNSDLYNMLLAKLAGETETDPLLTIRESSTTKSEGIVMSTKFAQEDAARVLGRLDRIAQVIQDNHEKWGMPFEAARAVVNEVDKVADDIEKTAFGEEHMFKRQVHTLKQAHVIQKDNDEGYMNTFEAPMAPIQNDADENQYMSLFKDDQSEAVQVGKSTTGRPLAP